MSLIEKITNFIKKCTIFLRDDSKYSTIRISTIIIVMTSSIYILFQMFMKLPIDWIGVTGYLLVAFGGKVWQKKIEIAENSATNTNDAATNPNDSANPS